MSHLSAIALAALASAQLAACTVIRITDAHTGSVEVKQRFGMVSIEVAPGQGATIIESTGFGVVNGLQGFTVGYHDATFAAVPRGDCRVVLWMKTAAQLEELKRLLDERSDICAVGPEDQRRSDPWR